MHPGRQDALRLTLGAVFTSGLKPAHRQITRVAAFTRSPSFFEQKYVLH